MYSNKFVFCVLVNGEPSKELANGVVSMPFGTEYVLRFRNKHNRRAVVKISIDGENVSGEGYIINANSHVDIKRHHDKDRSFKFVSLDSPDAVDFGKNGPNEDKTKGTIEAKFYLEKERPQVVYNHHNYFPPTEIHHHHHRPIETTWYGGGNTRDVNRNVTRTCSIGDQARGLRRTKSGISGSSAGGSRQDVQLNLSAPTYSTADCSSSLEALKDGCTVEGHSTGQSFYTAHIDIEDTCTSLRLFLQGFTENVETPIRKTNKSQRIDDLESENDRLRQQLAEIENKELKDLIDKKSKKPKPRSKKSV